MRELAIGILISVTLTFSAQAEIDWTTAEGDNCPKRLIEFTEAHARTENQLRSGEFGTIVHENKKSKSWPNQSFLVAPDNDLKFGHNWLIYQDKGADGTFDWIRTFCPIS